MTVIEATQELTLIASAEVEQEGKRPKITIVGYTGGKMRPSGFARDVIVDLAGVTMADSLPILADHKTDLGSVIGQGAPSIQNGQLIVEGRISEVNYAARTVKQLSRDGVDLQASIGGDIKRTERIESGETVTVNGQTFKAEEPLLIVRAMKLKEISIVILGADNETSVSIAAKGTQGDLMITEATDTVEETTEVKAADFDYERSMRINKIYASATVEKGILDEEMRRGIEAGDTPDQVELRILRASRGSGPAIHVSRGGQAPTQDILASSLLRNAGLSGVAEKEFGDQALQASEQYKSSYDVCVGALHAEGHGYNSFQNKNDTIRAAFSTQTLQHVFSNAMNKSIVAAYSESPPSWKAIASIKNAADFKEQKGIRPTTVGNLEEVGKDGEIKHGTFDESIYPWSIDTFAKTLGITRQDIINDDLGWLSDLAPSFGRMAMRSLSDLVYSTLLGNAGSFFSSGNGNYQEGSGTALATDALSAAVTAMRKQRDAQNNDLDITPRTLLVPPELAETAKAVLESEYIERAVDLPSGNPLRNIVRLAIESRLSNTAKFSNGSALGWYLFSNPADAALIVGFLEGKQTPTIEFFGLDNDPRHLGVKWRCYFDYGVALGDPKAAFKSKGEA